MATTRVMITWDESSGVRERLALLAAKGPQRCGAAWRYLPNADKWARAEPTMLVEVRQEGSESLTIIAKRWGLTRAEAMALIGCAE